MKEPSEDKLRELLQKKYGGFDPEIPTDAWTHISGALGDKNKKARFRMKWLLIGLIFVTIGSLAVLQVQQSSKTNQHPIGQENLDTKTAQLTEQKEGKKVVGSSLSNQENAPKNSELITVKEAEGKDKTTEKTDVKKSKIEEGTPAQDSKSDSSFTDPGGIQDKLSPNNGRFYAKQPLISVASGNGEENASKTKTLSFIELLNIPEWNKTITPLDSVDVLATHWTYGPRDSLLNEKMITFGIQSSGNVNYITPTLNDQVLIGPDKASNKKITATLNTSIYARYSMPLIKRVHATGSLGYSLMSNQINYEEFELTLVEPSLFGLNVDQLRNTTYYTSHVSHKIESGTFSAMTFTVGLEYQVLKQIPRYFMDVNVGRSITFNQKDNEISALYDKQYSIWTIGVSANYPFLKTNQLKLRLFSSGSFSQFNSSEKFLFKPQQFGIDIGFIPNWFRRKKSSSVGGNRE